MPDMTLYFFPLSCARVAMTALERTGAAYAVKLINLMAHQQKSDEYLAINPDGRVPALQVGAKLLIENVAIVLHLNAMFPDAKLLPEKADAMDAAMVRADLIWCATTLHPIIRQVRATHHYTTGDTAPVKAKGLEAMARHLPALQARFDRQRWWFGAEWSAVDAYLAWILPAYTGSGGDMSAYPALAAYMARLVTEPAYERMFAHEGVLLAQSGIQLPPGISR